MIMAKRLILEGLKMKVTNHVLVYANKDRWRQAIKERPKPFYNIETQIKSCCVESISKVIDYEEHSKKWGGPILDIHGDKQDWFRSLYYIRYTTKLRIWAA